jgi:uncharacterized membrane protein YhaH (DUF805 family)
MLDIAAPIRVLNSARRAVPAVNFALGVAGIGAAGALVTIFVGNDRAGLIVIALLFVGMLLLFLFAQLVVARAPAVKFAGVVMMWGVLVFFLTFLGFTVTAFAIEWPAAWSRFLGISQMQNPELKYSAREKLSKALEQVSWINEAKTLYIYRSFENYGRCAPELNCKSDWAILKQQLGDIYASVNEARKAIALYSSQLSPREKLNFQTVMAQLEVRESLVAKYVNNPNEPPPSKEEAKRLRDEHNKVETQLRLELKRLQEMVN